MSAESWERTRNIMGCVSIADRKTLVSIWSHNCNWSQGIADDHIRSQEIEHGSIFCDRLGSRSQDRRRSQKYVSIWSQPIAEFIAICDLQSAIICKPALSGCEKKAICHFLYPHSRSEKSLQQKRPNQNLLSAGISWGRGPFHPYLCDVKSSFDLFIIDVLR